MEAAADPGQIRAGIAAAFIKMCRIAWRGGRFPPRLLVCPAGSRRPAYVHPELSV